MAKQKLSETKKWLHFRDNWIKDQPLVCGYCGRDDLLNDAPPNPKGKGSHVFNRISGLDPDRIATVDHIYPQGKGGPKYDPNNLIVACQDCNQMKRDTPLNDWIDHLKRIIAYTEKKPSLTERLISLFK